MKKFIIHLILFSCLSFLIGEVIIRTFKLVSDIPQRYVDSQTGIQIYKPGQSGYYKQSDEAWNVNDYGWVGVANTGRKDQLTIIGDSYIENLMNPISCNQGSILQSYFNDIGFLEAGRSGVSFIEAMEISKKLDIDVSPDYHLVYLNNNDFSESISSNGRYTDILQIDIDKQELLKAKLKAPTAKKILYSIKLLYYFYNRFPLFVAKQNIGETKEKLKKEKPVFDRPTYEKLLSYAAENYNRQKIVFIFHPGIKKEFLDLSKKYDFNFLALSSEGDKNWGLNNADGHWSCYGHERAALQIKRKIEQLNFQIR